MNANAYANEESIRAAYAAAAHGDPAPLLDMFAEDIQWHVGGRSPLAGTYEGTAGVLSFFGKSMDLYGGTRRVQVVDVLANDRHAVVLADEEAQHAGHTLRYRSVHVFEFRAGRIASFRSYQDDSYNDYWK